MASAVVVDVLVINGVVMHIVVQGWKYVWGASLHCGVLILILWTWGCGDASRYSEEGPRHDVSWEESAQDADADTMDFGDDAFDGQNVAHVAARKRIRSARLSLQVGDMGATDREIRRIAEAHAADIDAEALHDYTWRIERSMTLRVPVARFDDLLAALQKAGDKVENLVVSTEDVTRLSADLDARMSALRATEQRYLEILESAQSVPDVLAIESELSSVRLRIEQLDAQARSLENRVQRSTIELTYYVQKPDTGAEKASFGADFVDALQWGMRGFRSTFLAMVALWPFMILGGVIVWWLGRRSRRRR